MRGCNGKLRMWGFLPKRGEGLPPKEDEIDDMLPMNPEGVKVDVS